jgi:hypothetical protein
MKNLLTFAGALLIASSIFAQEENSLQSSFNSALSETDESSKEAISNFEANYDISSNTVQLKWATTAETNSNHFIVEKSSDKNTWEEVSIVDGQENHTQEVDYFQLDFHPTEVITYYRLRQDNKNIKSLFSNVVPVKYNSDKYIKKSTLNLFPNTAEKNIKIEFKNIVEKEMLLVLRNKKGEEYYSKAVLDIKDDAIIVIPIEATIPSGNYLITASSENEVYSQNIIIE